LPDGFGPTLTAAAAAIESGELSPVDLVDACLARAEQTAELGAWVALDAERARADAARLAAEPVRGPLHGIPVGVKDLVDVAGLPTRAGAPAVVGEAPAERDAGIVAALREAGAIALGKTATHGLALGVTTPAVTNPVDADRIAGGSSGGSAAAVATGGCLLAVGTDTAGSIRIPAACCGVAGLMPRPGRLSREGVIPGAPSFDSVGLLAGSAGDLALAWAALTGEAAAPGAERAGTVPTAALGRVDDAVVDAALQAATRLAESGTRVDETEVPAFGAWGPHRAVVIGAEALAVHREAGWWPARADDYPADVRRQLEEAEGLDAAQVEAAREALAGLARALREALAEAGVLIVPTLPVPAPARAEATGDAAADLRSAGLLTRLCGPVNAAGLASLSVPAGDDGHGVQLIAAGERRALAAGAALMQPAATGEPR